jgi:hypothetical protein
MNQFEIAADALADVARTEAKAVADRAACRTKLFMTVLTSLQESGEFPNGVPIPPVVATCDSVFEALAEKARSAMMHRKDLNSSTITADLITLDDAYLPNVARMVCNSVLGSVRKMREDAASRRNPIQPGQSTDGGGIAGVLQHIEAREASVIRRDYPAKQGKR